MWINLIVDTQYWNGVYYTPCRSYLSLNSFSFLVSSRLLFYNFKINSKHIILTSQDRTGSQYKNNSMIPSTSANYDGFRNSAAK